MATLNLIALLALSIFGAPRGLCGEGSDHSHRAFGRLLAAHVESGWVDYSGLRREESGLDAYLDARKNRYDPETKTLHLSPVFKWFKKDFTSHSGSVVSYVLKYLPRDASRSLLRDRSEAEIEYTGYDWNLNDRASKPSRGGAP